ncbi:MAG: DUF4159 domain-containing protein [Phycisphaerae bacterium]
MRRVLVLGLAVAVCVGGVSRPAGAKVTSDQVNRAIQKAREFLINQQQPDGSWGGQAGYSALAFMTLAYMGEHPNREVMTKGLNHLMSLDPDRNMDGGPGSPRCRGYTLPIRVMGLSYIHNKLLGEKRELVRKHMLADLLRIRVGQAANGGWRYGLDATDWDFSVSQWPLLAIREASLVGIEFPTDCLLKARDLYYSKQKPDGGWNYGAQGEGQAPYGSMTAAGLASVYIIADVLEPASGCPCKGGRSSSDTSESDRRIDKALEWLGKNFGADKNPQSDGTAGGGKDLYWLYCVERVGIAAGYKYFGTHDWFQEGAEVLVGRQGGNGSWGDLPNTCFATLFLFKGRAPVLFQKLEFQGEWNMHRRDLANLTHYIERIKEQMFQWQIVSLRAPVEELHDAPILYITAESVPEWTDGKGKKQRGFSPEETRKLRAFTDSGGTVLVEASCGNAAVRRWFPQFAKQVWPEWTLSALSAEHAVWQSVYPMTQKPAAMGVEDGVRTSVFFVPDDISCPWQMKAYALRKYLFDWGVNLYTYAMDGAPLRWKLAGREPKPSEKYAGPIKAGGRKTLKIARVKHGGDWSAGANYAGFKRLAEHLKKKAGLTIEVAEATAPPFTEGGVAAADLAKYDVAYLAGTKALGLSAENREALKSFVAAGGLLWFEAVTGSVDFDQSVKQFAQDMGWELKMLPATHGLMTGRMDPAVGYNLTTEVEFRRALRVSRLGRPYAEFMGLYNGERLVGLYSPLDVLFSLQPYEAWSCKGYQPADAEAVATNIALYATSRQDTR